MSDQVGLRFTACGCGAKGLVRIDRTGWMRLVPTRRHYYCPVCRRHQFLTRREVKLALSRPPVPPPSAAELLCEAVPLEQGADGDPNATVPYQHQLPHGRAQRRGASPWAALLPQSGAHQFGLAHLLALLVLLVAGLIAAADLLAG